MGELFSEDIAARGAATLAAWNLQWPISPFGGAKRGGDRFLAIENEGSLWFLMADASGHGAPAEELWRDHGAMIRGAFRDVVRLPPESQTSEAWIRRFAGQVNERLAGRCWTAELPPHLCATVRVLRTAGELTWANFGYGTHALALAAKGVAWNQPARHFGLKLGGLEPDDWERAPGRLQ